MPKQNMTSGSSNRVSIRTARLADLVRIKEIADQFRNELGFVMRPALEKSIRARELLVATRRTEGIVGFVHYHHRRDEQTTLYHIAVSASHHHGGIGRALIEALKKEAVVREKASILLKCPTDLLANKFYADCGFTLASTTQGRVRALNIWKYELTDK